MCINFTLDLARVNLDESTNLLLVVDYRPVTSIPGPETVCLGERHKAVLCGRGILRSFHHLRFEISSSSCSILGKKIDGRDTSI